MELFSTMIAGSGNSNEGGKGKEGKTTTTTSSTTQPVKKKEKNTRGTKLIGQEIGGPTGPEPTRYGDWERKGRCSDF